MQWLERLRPVSLLLVRLATGAIFMVHGWEKYQSGASTTGRMMAKMGLPAFFGMVAIVLELGGGALLIVGLFTRILGLLFTIEMVVAIFAAHMSHGVRAIHNYEFPLAVSMASLALATFGAGSISLDGVLGRTKTRGRP